ncbi:unnamed protein product [marine sediment metagenome]|uniref:Uncharacterized protein n=1 Tax=marine sediment metagenome TaxID=412755 RepID=X1VIT6_9ZZZZ
MGEATEMTLHSQAMKWIKEVVNGVVNHGTNFYDYLGKFPDVIVFHEKQSQKVKEMHEVETISINTSKIDAYSHSDFHVTPKKQRLNRVLWIALPFLDTAFHEVKIITKCKGKGFDLIGECEIKAPYSLEPWRKNK